MTAHPRPGKIRAVSHTVTPDVEASLPITAIIPAYNRADLVGRAILSAQRQRPLPPQEIIVVDDASSDDTAAVARRYGATVIRHEVNRGEGEARNTAIRAASTPWVALLDSDDEWLPTHLDSVWHQRGEHILVSSSALSQGAGQPRLLGPASRKATVLTGPRDLLFPDSPVPASGVMVRRDAILDAGGFRRAPAGADLDMWVRVVAYGTLLATPEVGYLYHKHEGQVSTDRGKMRAGLEALVESFADEPWCDEQLRRLVGVRADWDEMMGAVRARDLARTRSLAGRVVRTPGAVSAVGALATARLRRRLRTPRDLVT